MRHPGVDLRVFTSDNRVDLARAGLERAIQFGDGIWPERKAVPLPETPLVPDSWRTIADLAKAGLGLGLLSRARPARPWQISAIGRAM